MRLAVVAIIESDDPRLADPDPGAMWQAINEAVLTSVVQVVAAIPEEDAAMMLYAHSRAMAAVGRPLGQVRPASVRRH
jgi:hypothetical protein